MLPPVTYLTTDSLGEGVGASQVLAYVERLADRGVDIRLHTFEKAAPDAALRERLARRGVRWQPHLFGAYGPYGGVRRVLTGARAVRGAALVHARSDMSAASALLARAPAWLWDVRSLWADQRIALGSLRAGSPEERVLRRVESASARSSAHIVTLTEAVRPVLEERHGSDLRDKTTVITTCVDLDRFRCTPMPAAEPLTFMLAGTLNAYYDVPVMAALVEGSRRRRATELALVTPTTTPWDDVFATLGARRSSATFAEMPARVAAAHVGLCVCRSDAGVSLTAAMPTKLGEFLASGRPVVVNEELGDAGTLVEGRQVGVAIRPGEDVERVLDRLDAVVADPDTPGRCRAAAEEHFDLDRAVDRLLEIYRGMSTG